MNQIAFFRRIDLTPCRAQGAAIARFAALLQSPHEAARPIETRRRLIGTLFGRASNVLMVAVAAVICGATAWTRGGSSVSGLVAAIEVVLLLTRCLVILAYKRREREGDVFDPNPWLVGFGALAVGSSISWGALCFLALATTRDALLYVIPILSAVGTAGAVAARNSGVPRLAKMQLACSLAPICAGCLLPDDHGFRLLLLLVPAMATGLLILIAERNQQLVDLIETQAELARLSRTDALTQLPNRRSLDAAMERAKAKGFAVLMVDVDDFKAFNDCHGHLTGDVLLRHIAAILQQALCGRGFVARYGGEEFAVLLEDADGGDFAEIGERLRKAVEHGCRDLRSGASVTISVGGATSCPGQDPRVAMQEADAALYRAKRAGRNRIEVTRPRLIDRAAA